MKVRRTRLQRQVLFRSSGEMACPMGFEPVTFAFRERRPMIDRVSPSDPVTIAQTIGDWLLCRNGAAGVHDVKRT
jgi:hypothetical protein